MSKESRKLTDTAASQSNTAAIQGTSESGTVMEKQSDSAVSQTDTATEQSETASAPPQAVNDANAPEIPDSAEPQATSEQPESTSASPLATSEAEASGKPEYTMRTLKISDIIIRTRRRSANKTKVSALANEIESNGLLHPITVRPFGKQYILVSGFHRLQAYIESGREEIECKVLQCDDLQADLIEITENMVRNELHPIEIGENALRWIAILQVRGWRAQPGDNRYTNRGAGTARLRTTADLAKETGISERVMQENIQLAKNLIDEAKDAVIAKDVPKNIALAISRLDPEIQRKVAELDEITYETLKPYQPEPKKVTPARPKKEGTTKPPDPASGLADQDGFSSTIKVLLEIVSSVDGIAGLFEKASELAVDEKQKAEVKELLDMAYSSCTSVAEQLRKKFGADLPTKTK